MTKLQQAAKAKIDEYLAEIAPSFEGRANWRRVWAIERRFGLIGYGDSVERKHRRHVAENRVRHCAEYYARHRDGDAWAYLCDARHELEAIR